MDLLNLPRLDKASVKKSFNRAAKSYNRAAILQEEVLTRLLQRLDYIRYSPTTIIDIGCGTGRAVEGLQKKYPKSDIVSLDLAFSMLQQTRKRYGLFRKKRLVNADMEHMPFADGSFDLLFSNLALQWINDFRGTLGEMARIGCSGGLLMFTTFGPATLTELRESWQAIDPGPHVHQFIDMHDIGDALMAAGFSQPVVDSEPMRLEYGSFLQVLEDLKNIGSSNADKSRSRGLMTPSKLNRLEQAYRQKGYQQEKFIASYEVIYGHAWLP
ncbi:MAG: malonyl-ACP O-methyltransferase BioC [Gammaproteobacteria bacterium]